MRLRAFLLHLMITVSLASALLGLFVFYLFPMPYFMEDGGWQGIRLIVAVDVVIGPLLTLIVASPGKSRGKLIFDFTVIGLLQLSAMGWGLWNIYIVRTGFVVFMDGNFFSLPQDQVELLGGPYEKIAAGERGHPNYAMVSLPSDENERQKLRISALRSGIPLYSNLQMIVPFDSSARSELDKSVPPPGKQLAPESVEKLEKWAKDNGRSLEDYYFVKTVCRYGKPFIALYRSDLSLAGYFTSLKLKG